MIYVASIILAITGTIAGVFLGWILRGAYERMEDRKAMQRIGADQRVVIDFAESQRAETPVQRETQNGALQTKAGELVESPRYWDQRLDKITGGAKTKIAYEDLEGMFLDQFLLRYFYSLMPQNFIWGQATQRPWDDFVLLCPWAKEMPLLFEQMTGYTLNAIQLNNAIAEWSRRLSKTPRAETPVQRETQTTG